VSKENKITDSTVFILHVIEHDLGV